MLKNSYVRMSDDPRFKKYIIVSAILVLAFFVVFAFFYIRDYGSHAFEFDGEVFQLSKVSSRQITLHDAAGEELVFTRDGTITVIVDYMGNTIRYGGGYGGLSGAGYTFSDGTRAVWNAEFTESQWREVHILTALREYFNNDVSLKYKYPVYYVLFLVLIIIVVPFVMYLVVFTEEAWERSWLTKLLVRGGEPTCFALVLLKAISIVPLIILAVTFIRLIVS